MTTPDDICSECAECDKDAPADRMIATMDRIIHIARKNHAMLLENRAIMLALAEHWGVTIEQPDSSVH